MNKFEDHVVVVNGIWDGLNRFLYYAESFRLIRSGACCYWKLKPLTNWAVKPPLHLLRNNLWQILIKINSKNKESFYSDGYKLHFFFKIPDLVYLKQKFANKIQVTFTDQEPGKILNFSTWLLDIAKQSLQPGFTLIHPSIYLPNKFSCVVKQKKLLSPNFEDKIEFEILLYNWI
jgi:hypothetical protein